MTSFDSKISSDTQLASRQKINLIRQRVLKAIAADLEPLQEKISTNPELTGAARKLLEVAAKGEDISIRVGVADDSYANAATILMQNIANEKPTLIVLEDPAIIAGIKSEFAKRGISHLLCDLNKLTTLEEFLNQMQQARFESAPDLEVVKTTNVDAAVRAVKALNNYAAFLARDSGHNSKTVYDFLSESLPDLAAQSSDTKLAIKVPANLTEQQIDQAVVFASAIQSLTSKGASLEKFSDSLNLQHVSADLTQSFGQITELSENSLDKLADLKSLWAELSTELELSADLAEEQIESVLLCLRVIDQQYTDNGLYLKNLKLDSDLLVAAAADIQSGLRSQVDLAAGIKDRAGDLSLELLGTVDLNKLSEEIERYQQKGGVGRFFSSAQKNSILQIIGDLSQGTITDIQQGQAMIESWKRLQAMQKESFKHAELLQKVFGSLIKEWHAGPYNLKSWLKIMSIGECLVEFAGYAGKSASKAELFKILKNPTKAYELSEKVEAAAQSLVDYRKERGLLLKKLYSDDNQAITSFLKTGLPAQTERLIRLSKLDAGKLQASQELSSLVKKIKSHGLDFLIELINKPLKSSEGIGQQIKTAWDKAQIERVLDLQQDLVLNNGIETNRELFKLAVAQNIRIESEKLLTNRYARLPNTDCSGRIGWFSELIDNKIYDRSAEEIFAALMPVVTRLKPVLLMSRKTALQTASYFESGYSVLLSTPDIIQQSDLLTENIDADSKQLILLSKQAEKQTKTTIKVKDAFADYLAARLSQHGYVVSLEAGSDGKQAELQIRSHSQDYMPLAIIKTDGPAYYLETSALKREIYADGVYANSPVALIRVWITEWIENTDESMELLLEKLELLKQSGVANVEGDGLVDDRHSLLNYSQYLQTLSKPYKLTELDKKQVSKLYRTGSIKNDVDIWGKYIQQIIQTEAPIHTDLLKLRIKEACGLKTYTEHLDKIFKKASSHCLLNGEIKTDGDFFLDPAQKDLPVRDRSGIKWDYSLSAIQPAEVEKAVLTLVDKSCGIRYKDLLENLQSVLGLRNCSGLDSVLEDLLKDLLSHKMISLDESRCYNINPKKIS